MPSLASHGPQYAGGKGSGNVAYTELCWRQDLVASNQIAGTLRDVLFARGLAKLVFVFSRMDAELD